MPDLLHLSLAACMFLGAALYSSVGHAGASAYIAFMALFSVPPSVMRPTALTLNILVASLASYRYAWAGYFRWRVVWPFLLGSLPIWLSILLGIGIGFLSGLTGTGGGIFLSPVIIFLAWSDLRTTSGIAAVFIFGNSIAGLLGNLAMVRSLPSELPMYIVAVMLGALIGTAFGTKFSIIYIRRALGIVLIIAGLKLIGVY
jgi:uncharacterized membrane protein YfcA